MAKKEREKENAGSVIAQNRKARHDYQILETMECGIALRGTTQLCDECSTCENVCADAAKSENENA